MMIPYDLSPHAEALGDPDAHFVDLFNDVHRVVRHSDGKVVGVIENGRLAPRDPRPDPAAPAVTGTLDYQAKPGGFGVSP